MEPLAQQGRGLPSVPGVSHCCSAFDGTQTEHRRNSPLASHWGGHLTGHLFRELEKVASAASASYRKPTLACGNQAEAECVSQPPHSLRSLRTASAVFGHEKSPRFTSGSEPDTWSTSGA